MNFLILKNGRITLKYGPALVPYGTAFSSRPVASRGTTFFVPSRPVPRDSRPVDISNTDNEINRQQEDNKSDKVTSDSREEMRDR